MATWIGTPLRELARFQEARELLARFAADASLAQLGEEEVSSLLSNLASILQDLGELSDARRLLEHAIQIDEKHFDPDHPTLATLYNNLGHIALAEGKKQDACRLFRRAYAILTQHFPSEHPNVKSLRKTMGTVCGNSEVRIQNPE